MHDLELEFVKKYVVKNKQERIMWELDNPKKKSKLFLQRFAHAQVLDESYMHPMDYMSALEMERHLFKLSGSTLVYFLGEYYIGVLSLKDAVKRASTGEMCIIYCGNGIGYYQGEQVTGNPPRFMLISQK